MLVTTECIRGRVFATRAEANLALFEYIDGFYNPRRIQKRLGYLSPIEFEEKHYADQAATEPVNLKSRQPARSSQDLSGRSRNCLASGSLMRAWGGVAGPSAGDRRDSAPGWDRRAVA
ncbi:IS3 family transposase [Streptomyces sp. NPDC056930]|uniref:IS3 family transposase n=1 Tax=Streptomyces sp. NPDC056930 TaxID=3345967 RepID=UPI003639D1BE